MQIRKAIIKNSTGLHARPASEFVKCASSFKSKVEIRKADTDESFANGKSIIYLISRGYGQGTEVEIRTEGEDEEIAIKSIIELIDNKFGEE